MANWEDAPSASGWEDAPTASGGWEDAPTNPLGGSNDIGKAFQSSPMVGGLETAANMISMLPGMAVGGWAAAGQGALALPNLVGLPGIGGASMENVGNVYNQASEYTNNKLFGSGVQYEPRTEMGKKMTEGLGHAIEKGIEYAGEGGEYVGGAAGRSIAEAGAKGVATLGPGLGLIHVGIPGAKKALAPHEKVRQVNDLKDKLDAIDAAKEEQARTQGEGTMYVGPDGVAAKELYAKNRESGEQLDLALTEQNNQLQRQVTEQKVTPQGDMFPSERAKAAEQEAQVLEMRAAEAARKGDDALAADLTKKAEQARAMGTEYADPRLQQNLDLQTTANRVEEASPNAMERPPYGEPGSPDRLKFMIWETAQTLAEKRAKLAALEGRDPNSINWGRDWEPDTPVRSLKDARDEIQMLEDRQASRREKLGEESSPNAMADIEGMGRRLESLPSERLEAMIKQVGDQYVKGEITSEQHHARIQPLIEAKIKAARREADSTPATGYGEVFPGFTNIPVGTRVTGNHGLSIPPGTRGKVVGHHEMKIGDKMYRFPTVLFEGETHPRKMTSANIEEVHAPREARPNAERELPLKVQEYVAPKDLPKFRQVLDHLSSLFTGLNFNRVKVAEQWRRTILFSESLKKLQIPSTLDGRSIIAPDGTMTLPDLVKAMLSHPELEAFRPDLARLIKGLSPFLYDLRIRHTGKEGATWTSKKGEVTTANAFYHPQEHMLEFGWEGFNVKTAVHEMIHAATSRALTRWMTIENGRFTNKLRADAPQSIRNLQSIYEKVKAKADQVTLTDANGQPYKIWQIDGGGHYGLTDLHEFAAEVMSNRYLQRVMLDMPATVKGKTSNMLSKFYEQVKDMLGIKGENLVTEAILTIEDVMAYQKAEMPAIEAFMKETMMDPDKIRTLIDESGGTPHASNEFSHLRGETPETVAADKMSEIAGEHFIPKAPQITPELVKKIAAEPDSSGGKMGTIKKNMTPGMLSASQLTGSTMFKTVYGLMNTAYKRSEFMIAKHVKPVQQAFIGIMRNPQVAAISHEILMREMRKGKDYTAEELRSAGVSDTVIQAHLQFRGMMQTALEAQNAHLRARGLPEIKAIDAYVSSRWSGPWRANIRDVDGNIVFQVAEHSRRGAQAAIEHLKKNNKDLKFEDPAYRHGFEKGTDIDAGYLEMLQMLDPTDPRLPALKSAYEEYLTGRSVDVSSQEKHFQAKKGVGGFAGDRPWSKTDVNDFFVQQFAYAENAFRWGEHQKSMEGVNKLLNDPSLAESQKNNIKQSKEYVKSQLGYGTHKAFETLDNYVAETLGISPAVLQSAMGGAKTFFYLTKLGLSIPFTITQFLQPAITTPAWHAKLDAAGFKHNPVQTTLKSIMGGSAAALWHYGQHFGVPALTRHAESMMSTLDKQAARYMEANGIVDINPMSDIKKGLRPKSVNAIAFPFEFTIKNSEIVARSMAFMGFVDHLKQSGKYDLTSETSRLELFNKAEDMTNLSMTDYRSQERAQIFEKGGLTGDAAATLHAYQLNNLMQLVNFSKQAAKGNMKPLFYFVAMQGLAAGATGLWFLDDLDDLLSNLKKLLPHDQYMAVKDFSVKNTLIENVNKAVKSGTNLSPEAQSKVANTINNGLISGLTGTNINTRMSGANQLPVWPFEAQEGIGANVVGMAPFVETGADTAMGAAAAVNPYLPSRERWAGAYQAAPSVAQGPMENLPAFSEGGVSLRTKDLKQGRYRRNESEQSLRNYGLRSNEEQATVNKEFQLSKVERELQRRVKNESEKAVDFFVEGNSKSGVEHAIKYIQLGGDPEQLLKGIPAAKIATMTTELERRALQAQGQSRASILKLQRYIQQVGR